MRDEEPDRSRPLRNLMPIVETWAYFDHAAVSPLPAPTRDAIAAWLAEATEQGCTIWPKWAAHVEQLRQLAASLIGADAAEVALVPNTSTGINFVAEGYPWRSGDNLVTLANEFPSNLYPWMNLADRGVETRQVPAEIQVDLNRIADACDDRTRIISVSWVGYASGWRLDLQQLCQLAQDRGILLFLDAIQGLGVFPLDVRQTPIDFLAADGHKWMLGPEGAGLFYIKRELLDLLRPRNLGWNSVEQAYDYSDHELKLRPNATRYEGGSQNMIGIHGFRASLETLAQAGLGKQSWAIADAVRSVTDYAVDQLAKLPAHVVSVRDQEHWSGIVSFDLPGQDLAAIRRKCLQQRVTLSLRDGRLRLSPHAYNDHSDIDRLIDALHRAIT